MAGEVTTVPQADLDNLRSVKDKEIANLTAKLAEAQAKGMSPEAKKELEEIAARKAAIDAQEANVKARETAVESDAKKVLVARLVSEYGKYGVKAEDFNGLEPGEMETKALRMALKSKEDGDGDDQTPGAKETPKAGDTGEGSRTGNPLKGKSALDLLTASFTKK